MKQRWGCKQQNLSLSLYTSFSFLSFLWTKFICTETAQRFSCKKKKSLLFSADYIISSKILLPPHHITLLFYSKLIHNKMTHPYHIRSSVMTTRSGFSKQPSLPTYTIILSTSKKQQRVWWWLCHYECTRPIHIKAKRKKKSYSHLALVSLYNNYNNKTTFRLFLFE